MSLTDVIESLRCAAITNEYESKLCQGSAGPCSICLQHGLLAAEQQRIIELLEKVQEKERSEA